MWAPFNGVEKYIHMYGRIDDRDENRIGMILNMLNKMKKKKLRNKKMPCARNILNERKGHKKWK